MVRAICSRVSAPFLTPLGCSVLCVWQGSPPSVIRKQNDPPEESAWTSCPLSDTVWKLWEKELRSQACEHSIWEGWT